MAKLSVDQALLKAKSYVKKGKIEEAQKLYQMVLQAFPENRRAQQGLAAVGGSKQSIDVPGPPPETINQLVNLYNQGQLTAVIEQTTSLTEQYPEAFVVWNIMGAANRGLGHLADALAAFRKVIELNPNYAGAYYNMGNVLQEQGKLDEAIEAYTKAIDIKPDHADAYNNMGLALQDQGKLDEAITSYNKVLSLRPDYADAYNNMGAALKDQGELDEAIEAYNKALAIKPDYAKSYYNMGNALQDQGKLDEAIAFYTKALALKPDYAEAYNNMGATLKDQGKLDEAIEALKKALAIKSAYAGAYNNMGNALQEQGKLEEAIESYNKALLLKPDYVDAYSNTVELLKIISPKSTKAHIVLHIDKEVKEIGNSLLASNSDKEIALKLSDALEYISEDGLNFKTSLFQIYKRNSIDLNCRRHTEIFNSRNIIPEFCFGCFKVQVEVDNLFSLIRLARQFYDLELEEDITRKTIIEMRPDISGFYKGLLYCRGLDQAREVKELIDIKLKNIFANKITSHIKRGCSEFPLKFPNYGKIKDNRITAMDYPAKWKVVEEQFDHSSPLKPKENITPSISGFCLSDFYIIQKWIDYAKGLDDPSCKDFDNHPIVFKEVFDIAVLRKAKYGKTFAEEN